MIRGKTIEVTTGGVRLDAALVSAFPTTTRAFVREAIEAHAIQLNGKPAPKGVKPKRGDVITVRELAEERDNIVAPNAAIRVHCVYEDEALLGFDKPAGMPVQPLSRNERTTLMNGVVANHPECIPLGDRPLMAGALHRIDADTSGLVLVARTTEAFAALRAQFAAQTVRKTYLALVEGAVATGGTLENDLIHDPTLPFCRMIDVTRCRVKSAATQAKALHAVTQFKPIARTTFENEERTLLEVTIFTGVTHQIRAQLALAGMHIVNDRLYGGFAIENQVGHALHAWGAQFNHPLTGQPITIRTPYPAWARL